MNLMVATTQHGSEPHCGTVAHASRRI
jgi:hypothetical protein